MRLMCVGNASVVPVNLAVISQKTECERGVIDNCIHEIVQVCTPPHPTPPYAR